MPVAPKVLQFLRAHRAVPTLTVYLDGSEHDPAGSDNWRVALLHGLAHCRTSLRSAPADELVAFERCAASLLALLPGEGAMLGASGWAGFASADGALHAEPLPVQVTTSVRWQLGGHTIPYLSAVDPGPTIVVIADRHRVTFHRLAGMSLTEIEVLEARPHIEVGEHMGTTPRQGFHSGTRGTTQKDASQRQLQGAFEQFAHTAARRLRAIAGDDSGIVLGGAAEAVAGLQESLPPALVEHTEVADALHVNATPSEIRAIAGRALGRLRAARQRGLTAHVIDRAHRTGRSALGREEVDRALGLRAVDLLLLSPNLAREHPHEAEELVYAAVDEGADVEVLAASEAGELDARAGGVAARLRFAIARHAAPGAESA